MARDPDREPEVPHKGRHAQGRRSKSLILRDRVSAVTGVGALGESLPKWVDFALGLTTIGAVVVLLRTKITPTAGPGQVTTATGAASFTYKGQQISGIEIDTPQWEAVGDMLQLGIVTLTSGGALGITGVGISVVASGTILGGLMRNTDHSLFQDKKWDLNSIWVDMGKPNASPAGLIAVDNWVTQQIFRRFLFSVMFGALVWWLWSKVGGAIFR